MAQKIDEKTAEAIKDAIASSLKVTIPQTVEIVKFGPFEWLVLGKMGVGDKTAASLLITKEIIERRPFHSKKESISWENCELRKYLNTVFLDRFTPEDREKIVEGAIHNLGNMYYKTPDGNPTKDKIFLLSAQEMCRYFGNVDTQMTRRALKSVSSAEPQCGEGSPPADPKNPSFLVYISDQNDEKRLVKENDKACKWWLRSPGETGLQAGEITLKGWINISGTEVWSSDPKQHSGVRPAAWVMNLS